MRTIINTYRRGWACSEPMDKFFIIFLHILLIGFQFLVYPATIFMAYNYKDSSSFLIVIAIALLLFIARSLLLLGPEIMLISSWSKTK